MFVSLSRKKPLMKELIANLKKDFLYASVLAVEDDNRTWQVSGRGPVVSAESFNGGCGYVARVFDDFGCVEYSFNSLTKATVESIANAIRERVKEGRKNLEKSVSPLKTPLPDDSPITLKKATKYQT